MRKMFQGCIPYCVFLAVFYIADALFTPYIVVYFTDCGLTTAQASLGYSGMTIGAIIGGLALGYIADKTMRPREVLCLSVFLSAALIFVVGKVSGFAAFAAAIFAFGFFDQPAADLFDNLIIQNVPNWHQRYNLIHTFGNIGYIVGILIAGSMLASFGYDNVFLASIVMLSISGLCTLKMGNGHAVKKEKVHVPMKALFRNWLSFYIYFAIFLWGVIETGTLAYATKYYTDLGYTAAYAAVMIAVAVSGQILSYFWMYRNPGKLPDNILCSAGFFLLSVRILSMAVVNQLPIAVLLVMAFLGGSCTPLTTLSVVHLISGNFPQEVSNSAQTLKSIAYRGIGGSLGSYLFGVLYGVFAPEKLMLAASVVCAVVGIVLLPLYRAVCALDSKKAEQAR